MESSLGLLFYNARFYDPSLARFIQADTIVPGGVQGLDKYAYTGNNPIRYTDPSGHETCDADGNCGEYRVEYNQSGDDLDAEQYWMEMIKATFGSKLDNVKSWGVTNLRTIYYGLSKMAYVLGLDLHSFEGVNISLGNHIPECSPICTTYDGETNGNHVTFNTTGNDPIHAQNFFHEFGHELNNISGQGYSDALGEKAYYSNSVYVFGGSDIGNINPNALSSLSVNGAEAIQHASSQSDEQWADVFANYMSKNINTNRSEGQVMMVWITGILNLYPQY